MDPAAQTQAKFEQQQQLQAQQQQQQQSSIQNNLLFLNSPSIIDLSDDDHNHLFTTLTTPAIIATVPEPQGLMDVTLSSDIKPVQVAAAANQTSDDSGDCCGDSDGSDGDCCIIM
ncbi:hypothetical protein BGZ47_009856 [Haplosporangium gracile]|nr:hypothetical protein BGZ47_009856 [Haplosporangium gracile]